MCLLNDPILDGINKLEFVFVRDVFKRVSL